MGDEHDIPVDMTDGFDVAEEGFVLRPQTDLERMTASLNYSLSRFTTIIDGDSARSVLLRIPGVTDESGVLLRPSGRQFGYEQPDLSFFRNQVAVVEQRFTELRETHPDFEFRCGAETASGCYISTNIPVIAYDFMRYATLKIEPGGTIYLADDRGISPVSPDKVVVSLDATIRRSKHSSPTPG